MRCHCNRRNNEETAHECNLLKGQGLLACAFATLGLHTPSMLASRCFGSAQNPTGKNIVNLCYRAQVTAVAFSLIIAFIFIPLIAALSYSADSLDETRAFRHAEELYNSGNYLIALKQFNGFINSYPNSELIGQASLYIARCDINSGEMEEAIRTYMLIIESNFNRDTKIDAIRYMGKINSPGIKKYLENLLSTSDIKIRAVVAETLGTIGNKSTASKLLHALEKEREPDIQEKLLLSISNLGRNLLNFKTLTTLFKTDTEDLKINLVKFMSSIKKNYTVKFLQEQLNISSSGLKPYIIWSLARIDPYLYGLRLEGTLVREESSWGSC